MGDEAPTSPINTLNSELIMAMDTQVAFQMEVAVATASAFSTNAASSMSTLRSKASRLYNNLNVAASASVRGGGGGVNSSIHSSDSTNDSL